MHKKICPDLLPKKHFTTKICYILCFFKYQKLIFLEIEMHNTLISPTLYATLNLKNTGIHINLFGIEKFRIRQIHFVVKNIS